MSFGMVNIIWLEGDFLEAIAEALQLYDEIVRNVRMIWDDLGIFVGELGNEVFDVMLLEIVEGEEILDAGRVGEVAEILRIAGDVGEHVQVTAISKEAMVCGIDVLPGKEVFGDREDILTVFSESIGEVAKNVDGVMTEATYVNTNLVRNDVWLGGWHGSLAGGYSGLADIDFGGDVVNFSGEVWNLGVEGEHFTQIKNMGGGNVFESSQVYRNLVEGEFSNFTESLSLVRENAVSRSEDRVSNVVVRPEINVTFGDVRETADVEQVCGRITQILADELMSMPEGVYA